jgi:hypothetical protein
MSPRKLFGNPIRLAMEASSSPEVSVTDVCAIRCLFAAELDLFLMSGLHIPYASLACLALSVDDRGQGSG